MLKAHRWLIQHQKQFHYFILALSAIILLCSMRMNPKIRNEFSLLIQHLSFLLFGACLLYLWAWHRYNRNEHFRKRIASEYRHKIYKQPYKLERLSKQEFEVMTYLLNDYSIDETSRRMQLSYSALYHDIGNIREKLEVTREEGFLDIEWKNVL